MASISTQTSDRTRAKYKVRWREDDGRARSESFTSLEAAKARKREIERDRADGTYIPASDGRIALRDYASGAMADWLDLAPSTRERYGYCYRMQILPTLGDVAVADLDARRVQKWVTGLSADLAPAGVRKAFYVLGRLMADAVRDRRIPRVPWGDDEIRLPTVVAADKETLSRTELDKLALEVADDYRASIYVMGEAGLRIGEMLAAEWRDVDLDAATIRVRGTKTRSAVRVVPLRRRTVQALADLQEWRDPSPRSLIFPAPEGGAYAAGNYRRRQFDPVADRLGFPITPHSLRHTAITQWLDDGVSVPVAAMWAGHNDGGALILRTYAKARAASAAAMAEALDAIDAAEES